MATLRGTQTALWSNATTGAAGKSAIATLGPRKYVTVFVKVSGATDITVEVAGSQGTAGSNATPASTDWRPLFKRDGSGALTLSFAGAGTAAIDLSPLAANFLRLSSTNSVTATASADTVD